MVCLCNQGDVGPALSKTTDSPFLLVTTAIVPLEFKTSCLPYASPSSGEVFVISLKEYTLLCFQTPHDPFPLSSVHSNSLLFRGSFII